MLGMIAKNRIDSCSIGNYSVVDEGSEIQVMKTPGVYEAVAFFDTTKIKELI